MFLVNKTNDVVVAVAEDITVTDDYFVANGTYYVNIDLELVNSDLPEGYEVGKTTYTSGATFTKIGVVDDGNTVGSESEETETEEVNTDTEVDTGN